MARSLCSICFALALVGGAGFAVAQDTGQELKKQDPVPPMTEPTKPDQGGKQEPSSKVPGTEGTPGVLANGTLTAPGAPTDVDTAPSKFSSRTAADDRLPIAGYRLKNLTTEQKSTIYGELGDRRTGLPANLDEAHSVLGAEVPTDVALSALEPVPDAVTAKVPALKGLAFTMSGRKLVLVDSTMRTVVGVIAQ